MKKLFAALLFLIFTNSAAFAVALDGKASGSGHLASSVTATLTTTQTNDVIYLGSYIPYSGTPVTVSSVHDTAGLTWIQRQGSTNSGSSVDLETWYAISPAKLTSDVVTVTYSGASSSFSNAEVFGIMGANTTTPFDPNASIPASTVSTTGVTSIGATISTNNANDMLIGVVGVTAAAFGTGPTLPAGFITISGGGGNSQDYSYYVTSSALSSSNKTWAWTSSQAASLQLDAVQSAVNVSSINLLMGSGL